MPRLQGPGGTYDELARGRVRWPTNDFSTARTRSTAPARITPAVPVLTWMHFSMKISSSTAGGEERDHSRRSR